MGLDFQQLEMNGLMVCNTFSLRMTPLYHLVLSRIAFKKKNGFIAKKLGNYVNVFGGEDIYAKDYSFDETNYIYLSKSNIKHEDVSLQDENIVFINDEVGDELYGNEKTLRENDIIVTRSGTIGITILIIKEFLKEKRLIPSGYVKLLRMNSDVIPKFVTYYLRNPIIRELMEIAATGKNQKNLSHDGVMDLPFPSISPDEQKEVLNSIENIETEIARLKQLYKTEEEVINEAFLKVFKYEEKIKDKENYRKDLDLSKLEDRYLRTDPDFFMFIANYKSFLQQNKEIQFLDLKEFLEDYESGKPIERKDYAETETDYIHIVPRDIKNSKLEIKEPIYLNESKGEELKEFRVQKGDLILVLSSNVGDAAIFDLDDKKYTISHYVAKLRIKNIDKKFLLYYFYFTPINQYFRAIETGKDQKNLAQHYIFYLKIPCIKNTEKLVGEIEENLKKQNETRKELIKLRKEIHEVFWNELHMHTIQRMKN